MEAKGFDPDDASVDPATPQGIGNLAAKAVCAYRHHDGANQFGDEVGSSGVPYSDYTYYAPVNTAEKVNDPNRWQPIPFVNPKGGFVTPGFLTPHWLSGEAVCARPQRSLPRSGSAARRFGTVAEGDGREHRDERGADAGAKTVEFMRNGPRSTGQSGHWLKFAQLVSKRDHYDIDRDVKLFFAVGNVAMDAFIACWETKRYYDTSRPWTLVRYYYAGKKVNGWAGPGKGVVELPAGEWHPYSPFTFVLSAWFARQNHFERMFNPLANAGYVSANASTFIADSDLVMAVARNGEAAAYPIRQLAYHHLVQDTVGGVPIVVTY